MAEEPAERKSMRKSKWKYIVIALFVIGIIKSCANPKFYVPHWEKIEELIVVAALVVAGVIVFISVKRRRESEEERAAGNSWWKSKLTFRNFVLLLLIYFSSKACGVHQFYGPYWGRVVDEGTGQPIEGAGVIVHYKKGCVSPGGTAPGPFGGVQAAFTDKDGDFFLWPRFFIQMPQPICYFKWDPELYVLKERHKVAKLYGDYCPADVWWGEICAPTSFGRMEFRLKELEVSYNDYSDYSSDIANSLDDSEKFWLIGDTKKYVEMASKDKDRIKKTLVQMRTMRAQGGTGY